MNKLNLERILAKILIVSIIFTFLPIGFLKTYSATEISAEMAHNINKWLNDSEKEVIEYTYKENGEENVSYAVKMPETNKEKYPNIEYGSNGYVYLLFDESNNVVGKIPFDVDVILTANTETPLPDELTQDNYENYLAPNQSTYMYQNKDGEYLKTISLSDTTERQMGFVVELDDGTLISSISDDNFNYREETLLESFFDTITEGLSWLWDIALNAITGILHNLLLAIGDGIQSLIDSIFDSNQRVTVYRVIFGKIDKLSIDFWGTASQNVLNNAEEENALENMLDSAPAPTLKNIVSYWNGVLIGIAIAIYLVMLLYIGVRILLSSTGKSNEQFKNMLKSWLIGIIVLAFYPYVMKYVVIINDALVSMVDQGDPETLEESGDAMIAIRNLAEEKGNIALTAVYIIMLIQLIVLLGVYYKRVFMMAFLITIFPIAATLYIWEQTVGKAKALFTWTREYVVVVMTQLIHAVIYVVLIDGAFTAFKISQNWFIFMLSVTFLFEGEKIVRAIFGLKSSANTIGDLATAGATAWGATKAMKRIFKNDKNSKSKDEEDMKKASDSVENAKKNVAVNKKVTDDFLNDSTISEAVKKENNRLKGIRSSAGASGGGTPGSGAPSNPSTGGSLPERNQMDNIGAAQAMVRSDALTGRTKRGILHRALDATAGGVVRAAGVTLGMTSGMAAGSMGEGIANAAIGNEIAGVALKPVRGIAGWTKGYMAGKVLKARIKSGEMDDKLREMGFDLNGKFDEDDHISKAKAQIFRDALAVQAEYTRRGGKAKGDLEYLKELERGRKREGL